MQDVDFQFLKTLLESPAPSGYERPIQDVVRKFTADFAGEVSTDWHGNVVTAINPSGSPRIMLAGHCDQIGLMVKFIDENGYIYVDPVGGWDVQMLIGQNMQIWTKNGPVTGVIARKAIHLLTQEERKTVPQINQLWIDIGSKSKEQTLELVEIGDPVTLKLGMSELQNGLWAAPGMDDRVGVWVVINAAKQAAAANPDAAVFAVSTVQEEIGLRGAKTAAFHLDPHIGIAVDVTHATDCPGIDPTEHGEVSIGDGPVVFRGPNVNSVLFEKMQQLSRKHDIPIQVKSLNKPASNDGNVMQTSRGGLATGVIGIPNRYMHSPVEVISLSDLENAANLIAQFCLSVNAESDFTP